MKHKAFTLAEVLITLAIIGIVAAITIPAVVQEYKKKVTSTKLKKFYSVMTQAIKLSEIDNGELLSWDFAPSVNDENNNYDYPTNFRYTENWIKKYLLPYMNYTRIVEGSYIPATDTEPEQKELVTVYMADGSRILFHLGGCMDMVYDTDGLKGADKGGIDRYRYTICYPNSGGSAVSSGFRPYNAGAIKNRGEALQKCKEIGAYCSVLLQYDNWEFKKDYPYKL